MLVFFFSQKNQEWRDCFLIIECICYRDRHRGYRSGPQRNRITIFRTRLIIAKKALCG